MPDPVYILTRTSRRPLFFARLMETIREQDYPNIVTIVHSDDPRDEYVTGDIIIRKSAYGPDYGAGSYNLYNNRLLAAIPDTPGWYHFMDDDDEYAAPDAISRMVSACKSDHVNVARVIRWDGIVFPKDWGTQQSFQTECFMVHTDHRYRAKWWGNLGGDHDYSRKLTRVLPINWIDNLILCRAQVGKGHGRRLDLDGQFNTARESNHGRLVTVLGLRPHRKGRRREWITQGEHSLIPYDLAERLEKEKVVKITYP